MLLRYSLELVSSEYDNSPIAIIPIPKMIKNRKEKKKLRQLIRAHDEDNSFSMAEIQACLAFTWLRIVAHGSYQLRSCNSHCLCLGDHGHLRLRFLARRT